MPACPLCSSSFEITQQDLQFYASVSPTLNGQTYTIPSPTLCPQCRNQRRMAWRNDRTFYKRTCDLTGDSFISMYAPDAAFPVYKQDAWHGDGWNALDYGRDFDFNRPFFEQWAELRDQVPHWGVAISNCQNSDFCNYCTDEKNCYLDIAAEANEDCYYDLFTKYSKNCVDCTCVYHCTLCYECIQCYNCYGCTYSQYLEGCNDCTLCFDCKGCKNCLMSVNLRNKEYYIFNQPHTKEEYEQKLQELNLGSHKSVQMVQKLWQQKRIEMGVYRDMYTANCENCLGNNIKSSKNCSYCFNATDCEDCTYLYDVLNAKDCQDMNYSLYDPEVSYEVISTVGLRFSAFYMAGPYNSHCFYSEMLQSCKHCFGCVGLKQQEYCIFNKKYTEEQYNQLVPKIIEHMRKNSEYGEFFPVQLSPHGYNETVAQEYMPLTKEEVEQRNWPWKEEKSDPPNVERVIPASRLPDAITDIPDDIINWAVMCEVTNKPFRIIKKELEFYRQQGLPIPRRSAEQRHKDRNTLRTPRRLHKRQCSESGNTIWTSFSPEKSEKVVCEEVYLERVY